MPRNIPRLAFFLSYAHSHSDWIAQIAPRYGIISDKIPIGHIQYQGETPPPLPLPPFPLPLSKNQTDGGRGEGIGDNCVNVGREGKGRKIKEVGKEGRKEGLNRPNTRVKRSPLPPFPPSILTQYLKDDAPKYSEVDFLPFLRALSQRLDSANRTKVRNY